MSITVEQAREGLERRVRDISDVDSDVLLQWLNFINRRSYRTLVQVDPERYISENSITTTSGTSLYSLPSDFQNMLAYGTGIYELDGNNEPNETPLTKTRYGSRQYGFFITGSNIKFTPTPTGSKSYVQRYIPALTDLDDDADTLVIPDEFEENLIDALQVAYSVWDEDTGLEMLSDERFLRSLDDMVENFRRETHVIGVVDSSIFY